MSGAHLLGAYVVGLADDALVQDDVERRRHVRHIQVAARALRKVRSKLSARWQGRSILNYAC